MVKIKGIIMFKSLELLLIGLSPLNIVLAIAVVVGAFTFYISVKSSIKNSIFKG